MVPLRREQPIMAPWADFPKELVEKISSCPGSTQIDVLRLRAVCTTWRSAIPPFKNYPSLPLKLQVPIIPNDTDTFGSNPEFYLIESTVYLIQPINTNKPSSSRSGWLVKVMQTSDGKLRVVNPLCHKTMDVTPEDVPNKVLNLLDFRVTQVCQSYRVQYLDPSAPCFPANHDVGDLVSKILLISTHNRFSLMAIHHNKGELCYFKSGDEKWTTLRDDSCKSILDIIVYKGKFYAVDVDSETIKFDSSLNETKVASRLHNMGGDVRRLRRKRLVESSEQLFLVDMCSQDHDCNEVDSIRIYWLDQQKHEWTCVHRLIDRIFFAGDDCCFSVSSKDFGDQCRGNSIYYTNGSAYINMLRKFDSKYWRSYWYNYNLYCHIHLVDHPSINDFSPLSWGYPGYPIGSMNYNSSSGDITEELVHKYKGLQGHNTGVLTAVKPGYKLGPLLFYLEYADIFWPPPSWLNRKVNRKLLKKRKKERKKKGKKEVAES